MRNGRCAVHGGKSTGPIDPSKLEGNGNAKTHGLYSGVLKGRAKEVYEEALDLTGKELARNNATLLAGNLAEALDEPEEMKGARAAVVAYIEWRMSQTPFNQTPMPDAVANASIGFEIGGTLKRRIYQPALSEQAKVVAAITKASELADKKDEGSAELGDAPQGAGVLVLPSKDDEDEE